MTVDNGTAQAHNRGSPQSRELLHETNRSGIHSRKIPDTAHCARGSSMTLKNWPLVIATVPVALSVAVCGGNDRITTDSTRATTPSPTASALTAAAERKSTTPTPPPPTLPPDANGPHVEVVKFHSVTNEFVELKFIGEVTNTGDEDAAFVQVALTLTDAQGNVVGTGFTLLEALSIIPPGETVPFVIFVADPPDSWAEEEIQVQAEAADELSRSMAYTDFEVSGVTITPDEFGELRIVRVEGIVRNIGIDTAEIIQVTLAAFDSAGDLETVENALTELDQIAPGGTSTFEILVFELDAEPASFQIFVEGSPV